MRHALAAIAHGKHVVMVSKEPDVVVGPILAQRARAAGVNLHARGWRSARAAD
ncbi:MAG: hypothetical protein R2911_35445 [Caldilineaceae bacterium]